MIIMSVDFGDARTGIACCDKTEMLASPVCTINETYIENTLKKVAAVAVERKAQTITFCFGGKTLTLNFEAGTREEA
ncbi:MAG: RuvX/YqgF family protein [Oscillospiraceae bacterium]|nr:RuvX/YqgF family protein [Oscillospiraceae bacterium]